MGTECILTSQSYHCLIYLSLISSILFLLGRRHRNYMGCILYHTLASQRSCISHKKKVDDWQLVLKVFDLYTLVVVALSFCVVAGFIAWFLETWSNADEFPRPFLIGWFEGFWWSFVSMTTVGYGDKSPRSILARLFSIVWILIGLIVCGLFTSRLTGEIVKANSPEPADMNGANVGVLHYRDYDGYVVAQNGGKIVRSTKVNDFYEDFFELVKMLKNDSIDGMVMDYETLFSLPYLMNRTFLVPDIELVEFLTTQITTTEKIYVGEKFSYGVLVKDENMYNFLKDYVADTRFRSQAYRTYFTNIVRREWRKQNKALTNANLSLFSPKSEYFIRAMTAIGMVLGLIIIFGILFEFQRKKNILKL